MDQFSIKYFDFKGPTIAQIKCGREMSLYTLYRAVFFYNCNSIRFKDGGSPPELSLYDVTQICIDSLFKEVLSICGILNSVDEFVYLWS